jgi:hypothetical protein
MLSQITGVTAASAVGIDGRPYSLYLAYLKSDPSQWVVVRWQGAKDPCVEGRQDYEPEVISLPAKAASIGLTKIDGNILYFTVDGRAGGFDYVTKTFLPLAP